MSTPENESLTSPALLPPAAANTSAHAALADNAVAFNKPLSSAVSGQLQRIQLISDAALASLSLSELLRELLKRLRELLAGDVAMLLLLTDTGDSVRLHAIEDVWAGFQESDGSIEVPLGRGVAGRIGAERRPVIIDNLQEVEVINPLLVEKQARSLVGAPLLIEGRLTGVVYVATVEPCKFCEDDAQLLQMAADRLALAVERARVYDSLHESEERKSAMLEAALDCIVMMDHQGLITEFNPAAERTFGYTRDEVIGRPLAEVMVPLALREQHWRGLAHYLATGEGPVLGQRIEITGIRSDGTEFPVELAIVTKHLHGQPAFIGYLRDITERKYAEMERERLFVREQEARAQAETANRAKDEFLAMLSHELRTPLTALIGWANLLGTEELEPALFKEAVESIERNARIQHRLVEDLLDMSRIMTGKLRLEFYPIELMPIIMAAVDTVRPAAVAKQIDLQLDLHQDAGLVSGDAHRLQQVIWNLLSNAVKFTSKGGRIEVTLQRVGSSAEIGVADTGEGIAADFLPHIFEPLRQADGSSTRRHGGLGLGLAIVRQLVELHGGTVTATSQGIGQGATFSVRLPLRTVTAAPPRREHPTGSRTAPCDAEDDRNQPGSCASTMRLDGLQVLVVDDEPDARRLITTVLEQSGASVTTATSAAEAVERLQVEHPDVLISDVGMPEVSGYDLMRQVRSLPQEYGGQTPAIALTAYASARDRVEALDAGFQIHIAKPVDPAELIATVASLVARS